MDEIELLRKKYITTNMPENLKKRWDKLEPKLGNQEKPTSRHYRLEALVLAVLGIFLGTVGMVRAARPGDTLYPVRIIVDNTQAKVTGNQEKVVEKRADDILEVRDDPKRLEDAINRYGQTVKEATEAVKPSQKIELKQTLQKQQEKFKKEAQTSPALSAKMEKIIKAGEAKEGDIKGVKTNNEVPEKAKGKNQNKAAPKKEK